MGLFENLFGSTTSNEAQQDRQSALNAFNAIKTPDLSALQVQLSNYVNQGILTPQQAETQLMSSNAFDEIKTDPSLTGAQKQALTQLQTIGTQGGLTAVDKAQLQDIQNQQNQTNKSQNAATIQAAQARGAGNSGLNTVNQLVNEQGNANRASEQGTQVAANAQQRALQALQAAGTQAGSMEAQQYGEQANKANAGNAIEQFNTQNQNAMNLENTRTANAAQAANLANAQNIANANTTSGNANKEYNAQANQTVYNDELQKAQGVAGVEQNAANAAQASKNASLGANVGLVSGIVGGASKLAVPATAAFSSAPASTNNEGFNSGSVNPYGDQYPAFAKGGMVDHTMVTPKDVEDFQNFMSGFKPQGMSKGGKVFGNLKKGALHKELGVPSDKKIPSGKLDKALHSDNETLRKRAQFAENAKHFNHAEGGMIDCYDDGGVVGSTDTAKAQDTTSRKDEKKADQTWAEKLGSLLGSHADIANDLDKNKGGEIYDFRSGGTVPGVAKVAGDSPMNDIVPAKLSPGEVVLPRTVVKNPERIPSFVEKSVRPNPNHISAALHSLMNPKKERI